MMIEKKDAEERAKAANRRLELEGAAAMAKYSFGREEESAWPKEEAPLTKFARPDNARGRIILPLISDNQILKG